jgi:hypothetical protein
VLHLKRPSVISIKKGYRSMFERFSRYSWKVSECSIKQRGQPATTERTRAGERRHSCRFRWKRLGQPRATAATPASPTSSQPRTDSLRSWGSCFASWRSPVLVTSHFPKSSDLQKRKIQKLFFVCQFLICWAQSRSRFFDPSHHQH